MGIGAKYNGINSEWRDFTPLHFGSCHGHTHLVRALLAKGIYKSFCK